MRNFFNLFFTNIDKNITRSQYWMFTLGVFGIVIILNLLEINLEINLEFLVNILSITFIWPTVIITIKRLNDIGSNNLTINIITAVVLAVIPGWFSLDVYAWILIGIIPTGYIHKLNENMNGKLKEYYQEF